jgi:subtilisin
MTRFVDQELATAGTASVMVVLSDAARAVPDTAAAAASLEPYFTASETGQLAAVALAEDLPVETMRYYPNLGVAYGSVDRDGYAALRSDPAVEEVVGAPQLSLIRPVHRASARVAATRTWGIDHLGIPELWAEGLTGSGVVVAHLDTGVDADHDTLAGAVSSFAEFDPLGRIIPGAAPRDSDDHGTHTAATIAGREAGGKVVGVAPAASLASALVIEGGDAVARVLGGLDWSIDQGAQVLSMSLGFRGWWQDFLPIVRILRSRGILPVIAVGNEGPGTSRSPGNYAEALSIGAHDDGGRIASFSSSQRFVRRRDALVPDVAAPGVNVVSARPGGGFQTMSGTSMATPHVAGLVALLAEADPSATVTRLERAVLASCTPVDGGPIDRVRRGIVNGPAALAALRSTARTSSARAAIPSQPGPRARERSGQRAGTR